MMPHHRRWRDPRRRPPYPSGSPGPDSEPRQPDLLERLSFALRKESWVRNLLMLAWTAGPVTYLALQAGYHIGYGQSAPPKLFVYFAIYTVIAGASALSVRLFYNMTAGREIERSKEKAALIYGCVSELMVDARNATVAWYDPKSRALLTAKALLEKPGATVEEIRMAVGDLTGDDELREAAGRIEILVHNGLSSLAADELADVEKKLDRALSGVRAQSPEVADLVLRRFQGRPVLPQEGLARTEGFIERTLISGENHNFSLMSLQDAVETFSLLLELLAGRRIPLLSLRYVGHSVFKRTSYVLDRARREYRMAVLRRNSRLRQLAELLSEAEQIRRVPAAISRIGSVGALYTNTRAALEALYHSATRKRRGLQALLGNQAEGRAERAEEREQDRQRLATAIELHRLLVRSNQDVEKRYRSLKEAYARYEQALQSHRDDFPLRLAGTGASGGGKGSMTRESGIRVARREVGLSDRERTQVVSRVFDILEDRLCESDAARRTVDPDEYKATAVEIIRILEEVAQVGNPAVQYAVESSRAPNLFAMGTGLTRETLQRWIQILTFDVRTDPVAAVLGIARRLVRDHGMKLTDETINHLSSRYGADPEKLRELNSEVRAVRKEQDYLAEGEPIAIQPLDTDYHRWLELSR